MKYLKRYNESNKDFFLETKSYIKDLLIELVDYNYYGNVSIFTTVKDGDLTHIIVNIFNRDHSTYIDISKIKNILLSICDYMKLQYEFKETYLVVDIDEDGEVGSAHYDIDEIDSCPDNILSLRLMFKN